MSEKTKEVPQLAIATYPHTLVIKSTNANFEYTWYLEFCLPLWFSEILTLTFLLY